MGGHKSITGTSYETIPPPPPPDYIVTGVISPNATGNYNEAGVYNGKPYYAREDNAWFLWYHTLGAAWLISSALGNVSPRWQRDGQIIPGNYIPHVGAMGIATVTAGS